MGPEEQKTEEEKLMEAFYAAKDKTVLPEFAPSIISFNALNRKIAEQEGKYLEELMSCVEEAKLADENTADLNALPKEVMVAAIKYALEIEASGDPDYFTKHNIDRGLMKPIMQVRAVFAKASEVERYRWNVLYRARLIKRLQEYIRLKANSEGTPGDPTRKIYLTLWGRIKALIIGVAQEQLEEFKK